LVAPIVSTNIIAAYPVHSEYSNTADVGLILFTKYLIPFEVAAVMLLVAMIGGIILAGKKMDSHAVILKENVKSDLNSKETK